jgi:hypothetical protein
MESCPATIHAGDKGERKYNYSFFTSVLDGVSGQRQAPTAFTTRKRPRYPVDRRLGGP